MTVLDTSVVIDFLLADGVAGEVEDLLPARAPPPPPICSSPKCSPSCAGMSLARRCPASAPGRPSRLSAISARPVRWSAPSAKHLGARENLTAADGLFVALAELLDEPLATKDHGLARAARDRVGIETLELGGR